MATTKGQRIQPDEVYEVAGRLVIPAENRVSIGNREEQLPPATMNILTLLLRVAPRLVTAEQILDEVWGEGQGDDGLVHRRISEIRKALGDDAQSPEILETIKKRGYRIVADVSRQPSPIDALNQLPVVTIRDTTVIEPEPESEKLARLISLELNEAMTSGGTVEVASRSLETASQGYEVVSHLRRQDGQFRIAVQLDDNVTRTRRWASSFRLEDETAAVITARMIAHRVASEVAHLHRCRFSHAEFPGVAPDAVDGFMEAENHYRLAMLGEIGNFELYRRVLQKLVDEHPTFSAPIFSLANYYMQRLGHESHEEASKGAHTAIEAALRLTPDSAYAHQQRAQISLNLDLDYVAAEAAFNRTLAIAPDSKWCYFGLARIALRQGDTTRCKQLLTTALKLGVSPEETIFLAASGAYFSVCGDPHRALELIDLALETSPQGNNRVLALRFKGMVLIRNNLTTPLELAPLVDEAVRLCPPELRYNLAMHLVFVGRDQEARAAIAAIAENDPDWGMVAVAHLAVGDVDKALDCVEQAVESRNEHAMDSLKHAQEWDPLRGHPRFERALEKLVSLERTHRSV